MNRSRDELAQLKEEGQKVASFLQFTRKPPPPPDRPSCRADDVGANGANTEEVKRFGLRWEESGEGFDYVGGDTATLR